MSVTIGSGHEGNVRQQIDAYAARVKGGEMGALPSVLSLFVLTILFSVLNPYFFTQGNFANLLTQTATLMMLAMALVFVILIAEIDLSAGVTSGVAMALFILLTNKGGVDWRISIVAGLLLGTAIGAMIGFFVAKVGVPSFVVTLGLFLGFQGLQLALLGDGGLYRIEVPEIRAIMNDNLPAWMGWGFLTVALVIMTAINFYDRSVRSRISKWSSQSTNFIDVYKACNRWSARCISRCNAQFKSQHIDERDQWCTHRCTNCDHRSLPRNTFARSHTLWSPPLCSRR